MAFIQNLYSYTQLNVYKKHQHVTLNKHLLLLELTRLKLMSTTQSLRRVVSTSTSCLQYYKDPHNITILPLHVQLDGKDYLDGVGIDTTQFIEWMRDNPQKLVSTSPPTEDEIAELFEKMVKEGCKEAICVTVSQKLSESFERISKVGERFKSHMRVVPYDSHSVCFSEGLIALEADRRVARNQATSAIKVSLDYMRDYNKLEFTTSKLDTLINTGRLSSASGFVANLLDIKPILTTKRDGGIHPKERTRSTDKAIHKLIDSFKADSEGKDYIAYVLYSGNMELRRDMVKQLTETIGIEQIMQLPASPVIMAYSGIDLIGIGHMLINQYS